MGCGRLRSSPGTNSSISTIAAAPTSPVTCVLAPACSATAVRDPLVLAGKPWKSPAARFATPIPTISPLASSSCPVRSANTEAVEIVSVSDTRVIPSAPTTSSGRSETGLGIVSDGKPWGNVPTTLTPCAESSNAADATVAATTATITPGTRGRARDMTMISTRLSRPIATAAPTACPEASPSMNARNSSIRPLALTENPNSFGSCPTRIVRARPFM